MCYLNLYLLILLKQREKKFKNVYLLRIYIFCFVFFFCFAFNPLFSKIEKKTKTFTIDLISQLKPTTQRQH
jgi:hypothetical protein